VIKACQARLARAFPGNADFLSAMRSSARRNSVNRANSLRTAALAGVRIPSRF